MSAHDVFLLGGVFPGAAPAEALRRVVSYARQAEASGLDGVWTAEHHFIEYGASPSATLMAAHLLAATARIQVGTAVAVLSNRHPVALGEEAAALDALAPGRFRLGVGRGGPWIDLDVFATGLERYERGFEEGLRLLVRWLSGDTEVAHTGEFFDVLPVRVMPPGTGAPIWVAATGEGTARLAGRLGLPLLLGMHAPDDDHRALIAAWRAEAETAGRDPDAAEHASTHLAQIADTPAGADRLRASLTELLTRGVGQYVSLKPGRAQRDHAAYVDWMIERHAVGTAAHVAERLAASAAATGVKRQLLLVEGLGDEAAVRDNIAALGEVLSTAGTASPAAAAP
ncbi:LLM class flavin-dependent oxidoreductase [Glycomyces terrestris]|uniref:LLM class flavin-dependent oxidoreductase n=1 Tax=Glycomyces terrestris TaxID=2493553 RepID=A0A426V570_9ACTN|nr:LLM class flavin-dependent oxidoreductase [Glycomyces terrestris]RRS01985.1 LLM class flavin-dependent oxidoreductase [Glycomyces terrestris]